MAKNKWLRPVLTGAFYAVLVAVLAYYLVSIDWGALTGVTIGVAWLLVASVIGLGFRYWQTYVWITVLRNLGAHDVRMNANLTYVYAKSWLGRYIPGTAPWILGKIYFASQHGVSRAKLAVGSLLEGAIQIAVLLATSSVMLLLDPRLDVVGVPLKIAMVAVVVACIVVLLPPIFNPIMALGFRILRRPALSAENRVSWRTVATASAQYVVGAILSGASLFFVVKAIADTLQWGDFWFVSASGNLASAASMLAVFAPGGLGVREGIQLALLQVVIPSAIAVVAVVVMRVWSVAMDLLFFAIGWIGVRVANASRRRRGLVPVPDADAGRPDGSAAASAQQADGAREVRDDSVAHS